MLEAGKIHGKMIQFQRKEKEKIPAINAENRATAGQTTVPKPQIQLPSVPFPSGNKNKEMH